jgi:large subunit ribosomal protein L30e
MTQEDEKVEESAGVSEEENEETAEEATEETSEEQTEEPVKEKKKKKVVRRRKTKKERENPLTTAVRLAVESGKVEFGSRSGIAASALGKAKLFVVASNTPSETKAKVETYAKMSKTPVIEFDGSTMELGSVCGRPYPVSVLSVFEEGSSNLMELARKK